MTAEEREIIFSWPGEANKRFAWLVQKQPPALPTIGRPWKRHPLIHVTLEPHHYRRADPLETTGDVTAHTHARSHILRARVLAKILT